MTPHPLLGIDEVSAVEPYLARAGEVFAEFRAQDSGCVSYGVRLDDGERWFVKEGVTEQARLSLERGWAFHRAVRHPVIVPQLHRIVVGGNWAVVMPWHDGEVLYHPTRRGSESRVAPDSAMARFRALPVLRILHAFGQVLSAHLAVEEAGRVAVDLYDGSLLYDFTAHDLRLVDLDEYRPGPFVVEEERLPGSLRFMAPEELKRGAVVDARSTVFTLGRAARLLLDAGDDESAWRGSTGQLAVVDRATRADPEERFPSVRRFARAWQSARQLAP
ncbi:serine/threonine protein kinase [Streptomyces tsukubensis]|uniref:Serine/threonine protein kinase n=1 Tax=Streptomyces tsukubensis TaxID=83656 RepID=A0A1V4ADV2_9ACTN|nr:serine/threonine protein kinase [Streptomyces tsukubensis]OON82190.1 serine/threonine protein kinase [Streptomyces tsukubensis]QFR92677.1 serine/threonine protein kinase [Streptomyces tsukubensis]